MKYWLLVILLVPVSPLVAKDKKPVGYVLDGAALERVHSYCFDTHNLPPREVKVISQFVAGESKPTGLLARLAWHRLPSCQQGDPDAMVRPEFRPSPLTSVFMNRAIDGALLVFRPGSPSPIYETREVLMTYTFDVDDAGFATEGLERNALYFAFQILVRDLQKLTETFRAAAS